MKIKIVLLTAINLTYATYFDRHIFVDKKLAAILRLDILEHCTKLIDWGDANTISTSCIQLILIMLIKF